MRSLAHVVCLTCLCSPRCTYWLNFPKMLSNISVSFNLKDSRGHLKQQLITSNFQTYSINELICANICCWVGLSKEHSVPNRSPGVDVVVDANVHPLIVMLTTANGLLKDIFYCNFITSPTSAYWECQSVCFFFRYAWNLKRHVKSFFIWWVGNVLNGYFTLILKSIHYLVTTIPILTRIFTIGASKKPPELDITHFKRDFRMLYITF